VQLLGGDLDLLGSTFVGGQIDDQLADARNVGAAGGSDGVMQGDRLSGAHPGSVNGA
jgi:hypothetical protein